MSLIRRANGRWGEDDARQASSSQFPQTVDIVWRRVDGVWVQVQPERWSGGLYPVENLRLDEAFVDNPTASEVHAKWELPSFQPVTPNEVWVRVHQISPFWSIYDGYTLVEWSHLALDPDTIYTLDVKLVYRLGLDVVAESPIRSLLFTTDPWAPGPGVEDPGPGSNTVVTFPPLGGPCTVDAKLQRKNLFSISDIELETGLPSSTTQWEPTPANIEPGGTYRVALRAVCEGVPGPWVYGPWWLEPLNWVDPCDLHDDPLWAQTPLNDALFIIPHFCGTAIRDAVHIDRGLAHGFAYDGPVTGPTDGSLGIGAKGSGWGDVAVGELEQISSISTDGSLQVKVYVPDELAGGEIQLALTVGQVFGVGFRGGVLGTQPYAVFARFGEGGGTVAIEGNVAITMDAWHTVTVTMDADGDMVLYLGTEECGRYPSGGECAVTSDAISMRAPAGGAVLGAGWNQLIDMTLSPFDMYMMGLSGVLHYWPMSKLVEEAVDSFVQQQEDANPYALYPFDAKETF